MRSDAAFISCSFQQCSPWESVRAHFFNPPQPAPHHTYPTGLFIFFPDLPIIIPLRRHLAENKHVMRTHLSVIFLYKIHFYLYMQHNEGDNHITIRFISI